jgi:universal stress protein A
MRDYKKILAAVDLTEDSALVRERARALATQYGAELHMVHVMEPIAVGYAVEVMSIDIAALNEEATKYVRNTLQQMGRKLGIPAERVHHVVGQPTREIRELAKELGADLIVMGGHGKHGLDLLLGSTSSSVTHGVSCDLLIVRVPD